MDEKIIKPIPKYILKLIAKTDAQYYKEPNGHVRFYSYLTSQKRELIQITVAVKHRYKKLQYKRVAIHGIHSLKCYVKDLEYCNYFGMGYQVGWYEQGFQKYRKWFEQGWLSANEKYYNPIAPIVNISYIYKFKQYQYSAFELYKGFNLLHYLRLYERYPQIEYLMKFGLDQISESRTILNQCAKDKAFCKWLAINREQLSKRHYYVNVILKAYKSGIDIDRLQRVREYKLRLQHDENLKPIQEFLQKGEAEQFFDYIDKQKTNLYSYSDYLKSCQYLELDMTLDRNRYPHDFQRWHNIRTDEFHSQKAMESEEKKRKLFAQFHSVADKYSLLQHRKRSEFIALIAKSPDELVHEGEILHHCVGRMNYDQKFIREESLIFFIREKERPQTPLVTVEYSLKNHKVLQCYGDNDSTPNDIILHYVHRIWLPYANKTIKKLAA